MGSKKKVEKKSGAKVFSFSVHDELVADILVKARTKKEAKAFLEDHKNDLDWESLNWRRSGVRWEPEKAATDAASFGGSVHLDATDAEG